MTIFEVKGAQYRTKHANCSYDFFFDRNTNILHLKDLANTLSITRSLKQYPIMFICNLRGQFEEAFNFRLPAGFRLYIYSADALVYEWKECELSLMETDQIRTVHIPYLKRKREKNRATIR